jgi:hypothetical protein
MDRRNNPYAPGAGLQPPELAGRDRLIEDVTTDMDRLLGKRSTKGMMLLGLRGVGKTVLLNRLYGVAEGMGIRAGKIEAPEGGTLPQLLVPELRRILYALDLQAAAGHHLRRAAGVLRNFVGAFKVKAGDFEFGIEPSPGRADTGNIEQDLPDLIVAVAEAALARNSAIALFVDEVQYLSRHELAALVVACHEVAQRSLPFMFIGAGLPQIAALAGNAKSYAERLFNYPQMGPLEPAAAQAALVHPAEHEGVKFQDVAVEEILRATQGYPYFLQEWGFHVWNAAPKSPIRGADVRQVTPNIVAHLDANFFRVRFDRLTALQQKYLRAMAELGAGPHKTGDIAATLGVDTTNVSPVRQQLIDKGMIWSQRYGETSFTVPMFDTFMKRQMPMLEKHEPKRRRAPQRSRPGKKRSS